MTAAHHITDLTAIRAFVGAGNAYFTLRNAATGGRVTYNVTREEDGTLTVRAFTGSENSDRRHYSYLGTVGADGRYAYAGPRAAVAGLAAVAAEDGGPVAHRVLRKPCGSQPAADRPPEGSPAEPVPEAQS